MQKETQLMALRNKVLELGQRYHSSGRYLPIAFITEFLEKVSCHLGLTDEAWIVDTLVKIDIPLIDVLDTYDQVNFKWVGTRLQPFFEIILLSSRNSNVHILELAQTSFTLTAAAYFLPLYNENNISGLKWKSLDLSTPRWILVDNRPPAAPGQNAAGYI